MLILGEKYQFTDFEIKNLKKYFSTICFVTYTNRNPRDVRKELQHLIETYPYKYLIINTKIHIDSKMIKFLTLLQFRIQNKKLKIITIEKFLEKFLYKCYIPQEDRELSFLNDIKPYNKVEYGIKRTIDYSFSLILMIIHFFIKFYVQKKIKEQSPGKLYFKQRRVGLNNKEFYCIKFRSMSMDAEKNGVKFARKNDDRIFSFGEIIRKTRIDEIPQFINVLRGEMHLVGPRPERRYWIRFFEKSIPYYNERHLVAPGITGWAQVNYPYGENEEDAKQKLMYDLYYIKHWSLWLEIKIIFKTIVIMVKRKGI